jgi:hypothetical protein
VDGLKEVVMNEERKKVLEMLAEGKITAEDAERLLDKMGDGEAGKSSASDSSASDRGDRPSKLKFLRVLVDSSDGDKVNIRVPLALIGTGVKLAAVLPKDVNDKLGAQGVDLSKLSELDAEELKEALRDLEVDVDSGDGDTVRICCE